MTPNEISAAIQELRNKILSLKNDSDRAFVDLSRLGIQPSPFPITMFAMSVLDYFSALLCGWSNSDRGLNRYQTSRMVNFCQRNLGYNPLESRILVKIYRHSLMHTSDPKVIVVQNTNTTIGWSLSDLDTNHMTLLPYPGLHKTASIRLLHIGIKNLIDDLDNYLNHRGGYIDRLSADTTLQRNFETCKQEIKNQTI